MHIKVNYLDLCGVSSEMVLQSYIVAHSTLSQQNVQVSLWMIEFVGFFSCPQLSLNVFSYMCLGSRERQWSERGGSPV